MQVLLHLDDRVGADRAGTGGALVDRPPAAIRLAAGGAGDLLGLAVDHGLGGEVAAGLPVAALEIPGRRHPIARVLLWVVPRYRLPRRGVLQRAAHAASIRGVP